jgi:hypothetical protein
MPGVNYYDGSTWSEVAALEQSDGQTAPAYRWDGSQWVKINSAIPDSGMFQSPLYQYTAVAGLEASDGQTADNWTEQLAGVGDATAVGDPLYRADKSGFEAVEYDGTDDEHNFPSDDNLPTGSSPVSFAATVYANSAHDGEVAYYGTEATGERVAFALQSDNTVRLNVNAGVNAQGGSYQTDYFITVGGVLSTNRSEVYLNGSSVGTGGAASHSLVDANRYIGGDAGNVGWYLDGAIYDLLICDAEESDQAFSDYHTDRLG